MNIVDTIVSAFNRVINDLIVALPVVIGALVILAVGWWIAGILGRLTTEVLRRGGADRLFQNYGPSVFGQAATTLAPSNVAGLIVKWIIRLVFLIAAADFLGWPQVTELINRFVLFIPTLIVAVIILIGAPIVARIARGAIEAGSAGMGITNGRLLARFTELAIIVFGIVIAVNQVGIASNLINILFTGLVLALAIALGLSFGLGGRGVAEQMTQEWYAASRSVSEHVQQAAAQAPVYAEPTAPPAVTTDTGYAPQNGDPSPDQG